MSPRQRAQIQARLAEVAGVTHGVTSAHAQGAHEQGTRAIEGAPQSRKESPAPKDEIVLYKPPIELSPSAQRRGKDRHKPNQAEYMREYRARKKAAKKA